MLFTDKKIFTMEPHHNQSRQQLFKKSHQQQKHRSLSRLRDGLSRHLAPGKTPLVFERNVKFNATSYQQRILRGRRSSSTQRDSRFGSLWRAIPDFWTRIFGRRTSWISIQWTMVHSGTKNLGYSIGYRRCAQNGSGARLGENYDESVLMIVRFNYVCSIFD